MISVNVAWALVLSLWASLYFRRTLPALVAGYLTALFFFAGIPCLLTVLWQFVFWEYSPMDPQFFVYIVFFSSPLLSMMKFSTPGATLWSYGFLDMLFFAALSVLLMGVAIRKFKRTHERDR